MYDHVFEGHFSSAIEFERKYPLPVDYWAMESNNVTSIRRSRSSTDLQYEKEMVGS
jgi:hypothetical protein